jgi:hypothetical protein
MSKMNLKRSLLRLAAYAAAAASISALSAGSAMAWSSWGAYAGGTAPASCWAVSCEGSSIFSTNSVQGANAIRGTRTQSQAWDGELLYHWTDETVGDGTSFSYAPTSYPVIDHRCRCE